MVDTTRNGIDAGLTIDELAHSVTLPPKMAEKPHLREYYAVCAYFVGTMGWFDGNPTSLVPLSPNDEAARFINIAGGADVDRAAVEKTRTDGDFQWALQLVDRLIQAG